MDGTLESIVDLIRAEHRTGVGRFAISTGEAMELIDNYAKAFAGVAVIAALEASHMRTMRILEGGANA